MYTLDTACRIQLQAMACGTELVVPPEDVLARSYAQLTTDPEPEGSIEWPEMFRRVWRDTPDFAT